MHKPVRAHSSISTLPPPSRLLLPRVRTPDPTQTLPARSTRPRSPSRSRALSPDLHPSTPPHDTALQWLGLPLNFDVVQDQLEIEGYQMYAVEKWIVERNRPITVLTVYTGDPSHKITVTALAPSPSLSEKNATAQWELALLHLRRDASARPKQTSNGILMATSLAYFRSDYTIVHIPHGNFLLAKDQLYTNINLLRMGCGGRSALTLEEPSDTTKDRFISTFNIPETTLPSSLPLPPPLHPNPTSSDHLPLSPPQLTSPSASITSKDTHLGSPSRRPSHHRRSLSQSSQKGSLSKASSGWPNIYVTSPTPTSSFRPDGQVPTGNVSLSLGSPTLALLATHTKGRTKDIPFFNATVLELVKLVQVGLALFGMYDLKEGFIAEGSLLVDGLLCDVTVRGIERWVTEIGEPRVGLEPVERVADPMFVSALLSLVLAIRNKLSALGFSNVAPKDPFLHPQAFLAALSSFISSNNTTSSSTPFSPHTPQASPPSTTSPSTIALAASHHFPIVALTKPLTTPSFAATAFLNPGSPIPSLLSSPQSNSHSGSPSNTSTVPVSPTPFQSTGVAVLTKELVESIETAYTKRVASLDEGDSISASGAVPSNRAGATGNSVSNLGLAGGNTGLGGGSGPGSQTKRKVKSVLKGKLDDFTSVVANATDRDYDDGTGDGKKDERAGGGALSAGEGDGNLSVGSGGGQLFRGMGNLLLSSTIGGAAAGMTNIWDATVDFDQFVAAVIEEGKRGGAKGKRKKHRKGGKGSESVDFGKALPLSFLSDEHGMIVAMLWSGRIADVVALREWEKERERIENYSGTGVVSDGEDAKSEGIGGRSTEGEESDMQLEGRMANSFGGVFSSKMQKKLGNWAGLSKRKGHASLDISNLPSITSIGKQGKGPSRFSLGSRSPPSKTVDAKEGQIRTRVQSPTLHAIPISADLEQDEVLLDSGHASPTSDYKLNPFAYGSSVAAGTSGHLSDRGNPSLLYDASRGVSAADLGRSGSSNQDTGANSKAQSTDLLAPGIPPLGPAFELDADKLSGPLGWSRKRYGKRPVYKQRVASWSDSRSAWNEEEMLDLRGRRNGRRGRMRTKFGGSSTLLDNMEEEGGEESDILYESDLDGKGKTRLLGVRRRSYHDLETLRPMTVLTPERMKIDVELCAQVLIMVRREEHLQNVVACLEALTSVLSSTNVLLGDDFETHRDAISEIERRTRVMAGIDAQAREADQTSQATNTLQYESAQFLISELWHIASLSRKKVLELREKVFGAGGRRLPPGVHGAHGRFNRVQWTLDGQRRLVDYLGRTEEEAEEESRIDIGGVAVLPPPPADEEGDVVEHPGIKPMWLLRFFTSWVARWSALKVGGAPAANGGMQDGSGDKTAAPAEGVETCAAASQQGTSANVE